jgi:hypothetical protein
VEAAVQVRVRPAVELVAEFPDGPLLLAGGTYRLGLAFREASGELVAPLAPRWASRDPSVALVDDEGVVRIVGVGRATVQVEAEGLRASLDRLAAGRFVDLALGEDSTCGLAANGTAWCWGATAKRVGSGMRLVGETIPRLAAEGLVAIRAAAGFCRFVPELGLEPCDGMIGLTEAGGVVAFTPGLPAVPVQAPVPFVDVAATAPICGVTAAGALVCGDEEVPTAGPIAGIWASAAGRCLLDEAGAVACEGPGPFAVDLQGLHFSGPDRGRAFPISLSKTHGCGLTSSGEGRCWGGNEAGQIQEADRSAWLPPTVVGTGLRSIAAATDATLVVDGVGRLELLGGEEYIVDCLTPDPPTWLVRVDVGATDFPEQGRVASVHTGPGRHRCLLLEDGRPLCWGVSDAGETGSVPLQVQVCGPAPIPTGGAVGLYPEP